MSELTFEDLRIHYGTGRAYTISGKGRDRVMGYRVGMQCNLGDIEVSEWIAMVKELIVQSGEQELYEQLYTHMKEHNYRKATRSELEQEVLELHAARIFDDPLWVDFIPFNKRFRPQVLQSVRLIWVKNTCCRKPGQVTQVLLEAQAGRDTICCPYCGRWTEFEIMTSFEMEEHTNE